MRPEGPAPTTATRLPVAGSGRGTGTVLAGTVSTMYFFKPRMFTGASTMMRRQRSSQGCSQIMAQAVGNGLSLRIIFTAPAQSPSAASAM